MLSVGLFLHDLNFYDGSSEILIAGMQHARTLQAAIDKQHAWITKLQSSKLELQEWRRRGKRLLYSMMPRHIAQLLQEGVLANSICEVGQDHDEFQSFERFSFRYSSPTNCSPFSSRIRSILKTSSKNWIRNRSFNRSTRRWTLSINVPNISTCSKWKRKPIRRTWWWLAFKTVQCNRNDVNHPV